MRGPPVDGGDPEDTSVGYKYRLRAAIACFTCARRLANGRSPQRQPNTRNGHGKYAGRVSDGEHNTPRRGAHRRHGCNHCMPRTCAHVLCLRIGAEGACVIHLLLLPRRQKCRSNSRHPAGRSLRWQHHVERRWTLARLWHLERDGGSTAHAASRRCDGTAKHITYRRRCQSCQRARNQLEPPSPVYPYRETLTQASLQTPVSPTGPDA